MYCASDITEEENKVSCKGIQKDENNVNYQNIHNVLFNKHEDKLSWLNKGFRYIEGYMKRYEQIKGSIKFIP